MFHLIHETVWLPNGVKHRFASVYRFWVGIYMEGSLCSALGWLIDGGKFVVGFGLAYRPFGLFNNDLLQKSTVEATLLHGLSYIH